MVLCRINLTSHLDRAPVPLIVETTWPVPGPGPRGAHQCSELCSPPTHVSWCQVFKQCRRYLRALTSPQAFCVNFDLLNMEEDNIVNSLSDKSRSLRKTSVKKRLETELLKKTKKVSKNKISKKPRLNKHQRKVANQKERERMKRMNEVFERLKQVVPMEQLNSEDGKEKKVSFNQRCERNKWLTKN